MLALVYEGKGPLEASGVRHWLNKNGIQAFVKGQTAEGDWTWPSVWVLDSDRERARMLILQHRDPFGGTGPLCSRCGEPTVDAGYCSVCR
jgi:hypothetical protein